MRIKVTWIIVLNLLSTDVIFETQQAATAEFVCLHSCYLVYQPA